MTLYHHQLKLLEANPFRYGIWWETGTGKSLALIELIKKNEANTLLICPKAIRERWVRDTAGLNVKVMTKEEFRRDCETIPHYEALVIDEAHAFSNPKSLLHKGVIKWIKKHHPRYIWLATATPYRSTPWNCYALSIILGRLLPYRQFRNAFFKERYLGARMIWVPKEDEDSRFLLSHLYKQIGSFVRLDDCVDMPPAVFEEEVLLLTPAQKKAIEAVDETNPVVRYAKIHQIENGTLKGNEYSPNAAYPSLKLERILELAAETPKLAVFAKYTLQVEQIASALKKAHYNVFQLTGATKDADKVIREAENATEGVIVINTGKAEGYELSSFRNVVFASLPWSMVEFIQAQGRFRRINKPQRVSYIILTSGEVDMAVKKSLDKKVDFNIELYAKDTKK